MDRRRFLSASSMAATAAAMAGGGAIAASDVEQKASAQVAKRPVRATMKLGCQSAPTTDTHLSYLARYGVKNICGYPEIAGAGRVYATVDELSRMRDMAARHGISVDCVGPQILTSSHIDREKHPAIMLAQSPERDREIEQLLTLIRNCAEAGLPAIK
jgi:mannonate dehydratase